MGQRDLQIMPNGAVEYSTPDGRYRISLFAWAPDAVRFYDWVENLVYWVEGRA